MMKPFCSTIFSFLVFINAHSVWAAACCGGGFAAPAIIVGDDFAQLTTSFSKSKVSTDVNADGIWQNRTEGEFAETVKIDGARIFSDRWQVGISVPIIQRSRGGQSQHGLGDIGASLGYEYLPDWDYNPWRPKGIGFLQLTLPTGKSVYESENIWGLDSTGRGLWTLGLGTLMSKAYKKWDFFGTFEMHQSFEKNISTNQFQGKLIPSLGNSIGCGLGYNLKDYRFGSSITWFEEGSFRTVGSSEAADRSVRESVAQRYASGSLSVSYLASSEWAATLSYTDQKVFGRPSNTSLGQALLFQWQKRWAR